VSVNVDNALLVVGPEALDSAIAAVSDPSVPIQVRGQLYAGLRRLRLRIDRVLRPVTQELEMAMVAADAKQWGPLKLSWRSVDVKWPVNDEANWGDNQVLSDLTEWRVNPAYRPFIKEIPAHLEVDTAALGEAVHMGDPAALEFWTLLKEKRYRTDQGKTASLSVSEGKAA